MVNRIDYINKIKYNLSALEMYNNTRNEMLDKCVSIDAFEAIDENIRTIEDYIFQDILELKQQDKKCSCDGIDSGCSSDMCKYHYNMLVNKNNDIENKQDENNESDELCSNIYYKEKETKNLIIKSSQFYIETDDECLPSECFDGIEERDGKLILYIYDIDYKSNDSCCIPCILNEMMNDKETFDINVNVTDSNGKILYIERYVDVYINKFERYFGLTNKNNYDSKFEVSCSFRFKHYYEE